jgi:hypothetical protein
LLQHLFRNYFVLAWQALTMHIREELQITKPLEPGHEVALALLLTREYLARRFDECLYEPEGISDQQYNVLRILKGGPKDGSKYGHRASPAALLCATAV